jgi:hypothetical protein
MKIVIDKNGYLAYVTPFEVPANEDFTEVPYTGKFLKPRFNNNKWIEGATETEISVAYLEKKTILTKEYSEKIDVLISEHVQKNIIDGTVIPADALTERTRLRLEFHEKLAAL